MKVKIAVTGTGYISTIHARAAQAQRDARLVAAVSRNPPASQDFADQFGIGRIFPTVEALLAETSLDALVIGTPNALHAPQTIAALRAGVHVMVEKPMAMNALEAEEMVRASQESGALLMVAHCWRFDEEVLWLKSQLGRLGKIIRTKGYGVHTNWGPSGWFTHKELAGGGAMADMGIHALDTARFLLGDPRPVSVYAKIGTYYKDFDVDDTGVVILNWENGVVSYIESGWWQPHSDGPEAATQLYGTRGFGQLFPTRLELPDAQAEMLEVSDPGFIFPRPEQCPQSMYDAQMAYFIDCIQSGSVPVPGGAEGLLNMRVVDAAYESARTGKVVELKA
ncbi:MAG TPA: Gfo/Idh/MocA family oxidoreductase [Anaerolineales bacterium]|nr:Gfo/Idh/MocA family oxidoreductase [Anaerolineales bacterium]